MNPWTQCAVVHNSHRELAIFAVGCYIPPNDLSTLQHIVQAWNKCPRGHIPILLGNLNVNLHASRDNRDKQIGKAFEDVIGLTNLSKHFCQRSCGLMQGRWTWRMRRGRRWISSQCDYLLGCRVGCRKFHSVCQQTPFNHDLDHHAIITRICMGSATKMAAYQKRMTNSQSNSPLALKLSFVLYLRSFDLMLWHHPSNHSRSTLGFPPPPGHSLTKGQCYNSRGSCRSGRPVSSEDRSMQGLRATKSSVQRLLRGISKDTWQAEKQRKRGNA